MLNMELCQTGRFFKYKKALLNLFTHHVRVKVRLDIHLEVPEVAGGDAVGDGADAPVAGVEKFEAYVDEFEEVALLVAEPILKESA